MKNTKTIELIRWTTAWAFDNLNSENMPLFKSKQELDQSPNRFQLGFKPVKVRIIMKKMKMKGALNHETQTSHLF